MPTIKAFQQDAKSKWCHNISHWSGSIVIKQFQSLTQSILLCLFDALLDLQKCCKQNSKLSKGILLKKNCPCPYSPYAWHWERAAFVWRRALKGSNCIGCPESLFDRFLLVVRRDRKTTDTTDTTPFQLQARHSATSARPSSWENKKSRSNSAANSARGAPLNSVGISLEFRTNFFSCFSVTRKGHPDPADPNLRPWIVHKTPPSIMMHIWHMFALGSRLSWKFHEIIRNSNCRQWSFWKSDGWMDGQCELQLPRRSHVSAPRVPAYQRRSVTKQRRMERRSRSECWGSKNNTTSRRCNGGVSCASALAAISSGRLCHNSCWCLQCKKPKLKCCAVLQVRCKRQKVFNLIYVL